MVKWPQRLEKEKTCLWLHISHHQHWMRRLRFPPLPVFCMKFYSCTVGSQTQTNHLILDGAVSWWRRAGAGSGQLMSCLWLGLCLSHTRVPSFIIRSYMYVCVVDFPSSHNWIKWKTSNCVRLVFQVGSPSVHVMGMKPHLFLLILLHSLGDVTSQVNPGPCHHFSDVVSVFEEIILKSFLDPVKRPLRVLLVFWCSGPLPDFHWFTFRISAALWEWCGPFVLLWPLWSQLARLCPTLPLLYGWFVWCQWNKTSDF